MNGGFYNYIYDYEQKLGSNSKEQKALKQYFLT
jgi:hypothetical protein